MPKQKKKISVASIKKELQITIKALKADIKTLKATVKIEKSAALEAGLKKGFEQGWNTLEKLVNKNQAILIKEKAKLIKKSSKKTVVKGKKAAKKSAKKVAVKKTTKKISGRGRPRKAA